jgi:hypothetical protein
MDVATEPLPVLYDGWLRALLGRGIPREARATCSSCVMCSKPGETPDRTATFFDPRSKCCTFVPDVPNFLVGAVLEDDDPEAAQGRSAMERRIAARVAVTPLGVARDAVESHLYLNMEPGTFGRAVKLRCPYFLEEGGACGLWRHRNAICSTWFCKHVRGRAGLRFWTRRVKLLLEAVEADVRIWCALEAGLGEDALSALSETPAWTLSSEPLNADTMNDRVDERAYARIWGAWAGRETEFYRACALRVAELSWDETLEVCGPRVRALAGLCRKAFAELEDDALPAKVTVGEFRTVRPGPESTRLVAYSAYDPLDVPNVVMAVLNRFQDRAPLEAAAELEAQTGVRLEPELLRKLVDFGLLVDASEG